MATTTTRKKKRLSNMDKLGLVVLAAGVVTVLYFADQRGKQEAGQPTNVMPAAVLNAASGNGDAAGRDLNSVPRYPSSRRLIYQESDTGNGKVYSVMYTTADDLHPVSAYYEEQMPKYGWRLAVKSAQTLRMDFVRYNATTAVGVPEVTMQFSTAKSGGTNIEIVASEPKSK